MPNSAAISIIAPPVLKRKLEFGDAYGRAGTASCTLDEPSHEQRLRQ